VSILTETDIEPRLPRDNHGHFFTDKCPDPNCEGKLRYQGRNFWSCDGLVDPGDGTPFTACENFHYDGEEQLSQEGEGK
jgi:hypothetical protein